MPKNKSPRTPAPRPTKLVIPQVIRRPFADKIPVQDRLARTFGPKHPASPTAQRNEIKGN
jgi:hypothetical protein